ncbi:MAG: beta-lactamase family protein, partial [Gammaproteobacteria bacterium]|nr:beta-lactamase family protein [Gammaproteobacteria bacterium]
MRRCVRHGRGWCALVAVLALIGADAAGAAAAAPARPSGGESLAARVDALVRGEMRHAKLPGAAVAVVQGGEILLAKGYGEANVELHVPVSRDTVFESASVGKQFTAVAVMLEVEDGKLALDAPLTTYLPDAPAAWRAITVRHLLTHTSGIPSYGDADVDVRRDYSEDDLLRMAYGLTPEFPPGTRWSYSNTGYVLLGILIHRVSGHFYGDVLHDRVFVPLGMKSARVISEADIVANRCAGYRLVNGELKNEDWTSPTLMTLADGSLDLSLEDYIAWVRGLRSGAILSPQSWAAIYTPIALASGKTYPYGFGWDVDSSKGAPWYHHAGGYGGFSTLVSRHLADDLAVVVLINLAD